MADVSGPTSSLPGSVYAVPKGFMCDAHPDRPAVKRVQGETDSMGAEYIDMCQECYDEHQKHRQQERHGQCDWCKRHATDLRPRRDFEEGMCGPVYQVCGTCIKAESERLAEEMDDDDDWYEPYEPYELDDY